MEPRAIIGGLAGAVLGAAIWAAITYFTGYEVGYVAWGIGALVGIGGSMMGGRSQVTAIACAALALASIFSGKVIATDLMIKKDLEMMFGPEMREVFREMQTDARDFAEVSDEAQYAEFMVTHGYTEAVSADQVSGDDVQSFKENDVPTLRDIHENQPSFEEWKTSTQDKMLAEVSLIDVVVENLNVIDIIFALLGLGTAYKIVLKEDE